jgi:hypothetical protein
MPSDKHLGRVGGISAIVGVIVLFLATMLHPMDAHPGDAPAAFAEYALDRFWVATHLGQLLGVVLIATGLVALSWKLRAGRAGAWALLAGLATVASVSLAGALQAVDGVALKFAVDRWSASAEGARAAAFEAAYAVRQVEVGLASVMGALFGLTVLLHGMALMLSPVAPSWLGVFGALAGLATLISSVVQAHAGFSDVAMATTMPSSLLILVWSICVGIFLLRTAGAAHNAA